MIVVNLFGQPSAGKSTTRAGIFAYLKNRGCNVEEVNEFAKQMVYSKRLHEMSNQVYLFGKQYKKTDDVDKYEQVKLVVTDSPILLGLIYSENLFYFQELSALIRKIHNSYENVNVLVKRVKQYNPSGRNQTEKESDALVAKIRNLGVEFDYEIDGDEKGQRAFAKKLYKKYGERIKI